MDYKLEELIDISLFQKFQDRLNEIYPFPSAIIDNDGKILTATAWNPICTQFHRINPQSKKECIISDQYILEHIDEANPAVSYRCPHGMVDNAIPIIIAGKHLANFFTGQFFLQPPDLDFFKQQAAKYGFDEASYLDAVRNTPVWSEAQLNKYLGFIQHFVNSLAEMGLTRLEDIENKKIIEASEARYRDLFETAPVLYVIAHELQGVPVILDCNQVFLDALGYKRTEVLGKELMDFYAPDSRAEFLEKGGYQLVISGNLMTKDCWLVCKNGKKLGCMVWARPEMGPGGQVVGIRAAYMDITNRKETEQALQASELRYTTTLDALSDAVHVVDQDLTIQLNNVTASKWVQELGYSGIVAGKNLFKAFPFLSESVRDEYQRVFHTGKMLVTEETAHVGGSDMYTETRKIPIFENGIVEKIVTVVRDISDRKQAEQALRSREEQLASIYETVGDVIFLLDVEGKAQYRFVSVNSAFCRVTGLPREAVIGKRLDEVIPEPSLKMVLGKYRQAIKTKSIMRWEEVSDYPSGQLTGDVSISPVFNAQGHCTHLVGSVHDITERKRAEETLRVSEEKFRNLFNNTEVGMFRTRLDGSEILDVNDRYLKILGRTREEMLGSVSELYWADPLERKEMVRRLEAEGHVVDFECGMLNKQGEVRRCLASSRLYREVGILEGSILDITERKRAEDVVRESEEKYRTLVELSPDVVLIHVDGIIQFANAASVKLFEADGKDDLIGKKMIELLHPDYQKIVRQRISQLTDENAEVPMLEEKYVTLKGNTFNAEVSAVPITISGKKGVQVVARDISERKKAEAEVRRRVEELDSLQKTVLDITAAQNLPGLLESIVQRACQMLGAPGGGLYLNDPVKQEVRCVVSYHTPNNYVGVVLKYGDGLAGKVAQTGQPINIPDYQSWSGRALQFEQDKPFSAVLGVPLLWGGQVKGVIDLLHFEIGKSFSKSDVELVNLLAGHAAIAIENARLLKASLAGEAEVRTLSTRLAEAEENERRRIARELHDQVGQSLSALSINLNIMLTQIPEYLPGFKRRLEDSLMLIDQTTDHIRSLMSELRPSVLDDYGLKAALDWAAGSVASRTNLKLLVEGECNRFSPRIEIALFRIAQEALVNISRHARARTVKILLTQTGQDFSMSIKDDGVGFDPTATPANRKSGWGLRLMRERAESIGGKLQVVSSPGQGTTITVKTHDQNSPGR